MKFLLLNQTFHPDVMATGQYLAELAERLAERGHAVTVVTSRRAYDHPERRFPRSETWRGVRILRVGSTAFGKTARWRRAADFASFIAMACARLALLPRHEAVVALTTPPLISFIGAWRARLWGARFFYWVMDFNPDEAIAAGWLCADSTAARWLDRMSRFSLRRAACNIALDRFMRDRIVAKGVAPERVAVIPPWSHGGEVNFDPAGRNEFRRTHGLQGKFVVMYSGNHSPVHPLDTLLLAAERLRDDPALGFCFVGGGSEFVRVKRWAAERGMRQVTCLPYQPLDRLSASLSAADLHVVVMGEPFVGLVHPCKIYNILGVGAPVVCIGPHPSHLTEILAETGDGTLVGNVAHGEVDRLVAEIQRIRGAAARQPRLDAAAVPRRFSKERLLPQLVAELERH